MSNVKNFRTLAEIESPTVMISTPKYRAFLDLVTPGFYVESSDTGKGGTVKKVLKDSKGVPYDLKVERAGKTFIMPVRDVDFFEPYDSWISDYDEYDFEYWDSLHDNLISQGYVYDEENYQYVHPETGDVVCW